MEGADLELACPCGCENFSRVIVRRIGRHDHVSDLVACVSCRAVYHAPLDRSAIGDQTTRQIVEDAKTAARGYYAPGREPKIGDRRRKRQVRQR